MYTCVCVIYKNYPPNLPGMYKSRDFETGGTKYLSSLILQHPPASRTLCPPATSWIFDDR